MPSHKIKEDVPDYNVPRADGQPMPTLVVLRDDNTEVKVNYPYKLVYYDNFLFNGKKVQATNIEIDNNGEIGNDGHYFVKLRRLNN